MDEISDVFPYVTHKKVSFIEYILIWKRFD